MARALVFGITGQDGFYLTQILEREHIEVIGVSRNNEEFITGNLSDFTFVENLIKEIQPEYIFHLAANSVTHHNALFENYESISTGTLNILESVYRNNLNCKVFISGSAIQFKNEGGPINEETDFEASSAYSLARIQSVYTARYYRKLGLKVYVGYFFNHDSPLRNEHHINKKITNAINKIKSGISETVEIGDLDAEKEFNFAGDMMEAVWVLVNQDSVTEAVLGSGKSYPVKDWIKICAEITGVEDIFNYIKKNESYKSPYKKLVSDPTKIKSLGWKPKVNMKQLAELMLKN